MSATRFPDVMVPAAGCGRRLPPPIKVAGARIVLADGEARLRP